MPTLSSAWGRGTREMGGEGKGRGRQKWEGGKGVHSSRGRDGRRGRGGVMGGGREGEVGWEEGRER